MRPGANRRDHARYGQRGRMGTVTPHASMRPGANRRDHADSRQAYANKTAIDLSFNEARRESPGSPTERTEYWRARG